jgi:hypothetical protein
LTIEFALRYIVGRSMPDGRASSTVFHQACVIGEPIAAQWMLMSAAIGFCAICFQRGTRRASVSVAGCCCWSEAARRVGFGSAAARADAGL